MSSERTHHSPRKEHGGGTSVGVNAIKPAKPPRDASSSAGKLSNSSSKNNGNDTIHGTHHHQKGETISSATLSTNATTADNRGGGGSGGGASGAKVEQTRSHHHYSHRDVHHHHHHHEKSSPNERILKSIHDLYERGPNGNQPGSVGILEIAKDPLLNVTCWKPRKKVSVLIIGNHSAGKSSFINWYIDESIQTTGVAIETRGFTYVTSGRKRESLKGDATFAFYDHLDGLERFEGIQANVFTEVSTSKEKNFPAIDFIDTPGLVDGEMEYPFDVSAAILWLADHVDLVLVFFDPIGQALCGRTMKVIEALNEKHAEKLSYYMSKADQVEKEHDRQRVLIQITQNLSGRINNSHAFKLPTIYLPNEQNSTANIPNALSEVCEDIDKAIRLTVQKNLTAMKDDCARIDRKVVEVLEEDKLKRAENVKRSMRGAALLALSWVFIFFMTFVAFVELFAFRFVGNFVRRHVMPRCNDFFAAILMGMLPSEVDEVGRSKFSAMQRWGGVRRRYVFGGALLGYILVTYVKNVVWTLNKVLTKKEQARMQAYRTYLQGLLKIRSNLYSEYFKQLHTL